MNTGAVILFVIGTSILIVGMHTLLFWGERLTNKGEGMVYAEIAIGIILTIIGLITEFYMNPGKSEAKKSEEREILQKFDKKD